jgi:hypothetical protein
MGFRFVYKLPLLNEFFVFALFGLSHLMLKIDQYFVNQSKAHVKFMRFVLFLKMICRD